MGSPARAQRVHLGHDRGECRDVLLCPRAARREDGVVEAEVRQLTQVIERLACLPGNVAEAGADGLLDLGVVPACGRTVVPQDAELVPQVVPELAAWRVEQVRETTAPSPVTGTGHEKSPNTIPSFID